MYTWGTVGLRTWEVIAEVLQPCLSEHAFSEDTLQYSLAHLYLLGLAYPDPRSGNSKNVPFMQCPFVSVHLLCVLCMLLVAVATRLFSYSSQTTVAQSEFGFITALHCIMLATILPLQSSIFTVQEMFEDINNYPIYPTNPIYKTYRLLQASPLEKKYV